MYQHPIPQNVTAYEFHLIGNMTLKQFIELGVGIGVGVLFYSMNLPDFIKWPLVLLPVIVGAAMAFLPFDGRPLDRMIIIFFRAVYAPTQYIWRKDPQIPAYFTFTPKKLNQPDHLNLERQKLRKNLKEYLATLPKQSEQESELDTREKSTLDEYSFLFETTTTQEPTNRVEEIYVPQPKVRVRKMRTFEEMEAHHPDKLTESLRAVAVTVPEIETPTVPTTIEEAITSTIFNPSFTSNDYYPQPGSDLRPQALPISTNMVDATTNMHLPLPTPPTEPNVLVGMVLDINGNIIENAIVEIIDQNGLPIKALLTNRLGQFFSTSPLYDGTYQIQIKKPGFEFDNLSITLNNSIVAPLEIRTKA